ncbi:response regulator transcription factor [Pelosinus sp. IPA-1]|uniref:response regulator transcription factor n=1 Tax=Pelosinus sp. IPA-1 TaxID=3029569 RepID=UPI0024361BC1|nr:response regulator transcription factor [Pelosinus sp. IPA-1]GMA97258.1 DNA-binding response regulator [Pelosinus sp. IPA-1]
MTKVLLVEDEVNMAKFVELELEHEGFLVTVAVDGRIGLELALEQDWDIILLDIMLPELNGIEVCRRLRNAKDTPVIMLTARDTIIDRVSGLDSGADDYIPKPFAIEELLARMRSILRRTKPENTEKDKLIYRDITVNLESCIVKRDETVVELTKREYDLLVAFMQNENRVLSRDVLLDRVWGYEAVVETNVVDVYVRYLRNKLDKPKEDSIIQTVRGMGYVMRK